MKLTHHGEGACVQIADYEKLQAELTEARAQIRSWEEREAACCPEDFGFDEVIATLRKDYAALKANLEQVKAGKGEEVMAKIGDVRRYLFVPFDCKWNAIVRDVTAEHETEGEEVEAYQVFKHLVQIIRDNGQIDHLGGTSHLAELFNDRTSEGTENK